ncbi:sodium:solute symporter [Salegentibacter maritimus]|uniref:Sodium:solute symporter n=1 Tax=Salegentibacter maritimus TaxID=2794347 RepID=A0ABS0TGA6_9FLAO|nr:sodium:solute symporter [Salegentibacter maritimus]MBI6119079.1 sodium:solute symporter [Salegentibacter maritimus]
MQLIDWIILFGTLAFIVAYGVYKTKNDKGARNFIGGGSETRWWTIGLSTMATQASAITFLSTPGQAFNDGMGFVQFYFGLPLAMVVICMFFIPIYKRLNVYTAYEYLESRFDRKTRTLTAILFLIQRGLAAGLTIFAPAIILSAVLGWNLSGLTVLIGSLVIIYTVAGGTKAVNVTHKQQMAVILTGMFAAFFIILSYLPENINFSNALEIAGASGKMEILDFSFDFENRYTFWSGIIGGGFLALSYFGTDQSQVQRYLGGKSVKESRMGMIMNAMLKVPLQFFILLVGVMVFVFYQFNNAPLNFNPAATETVLNSDYGRQYEDLMQEHDAIQQKKQNLHIAFAENNDFNKENNAVYRENLASLQASENKTRQKARKLIDASDKDAESNDKDYVFIHFILNNLPRGLIGLLLAVILSAAMSSTASELNALSSTTSIDLYKRSRKTEKSDEHYVKASKWFTLIWGLIAIAFASFANLFDNLIQLVNIIGSIFYGNVLGIFLLAFFIKRVNSNSVFIAAIITQFIIIVIFTLDVMPYLWLNLAGCLLVMALALILELFIKTPEHKIKEYR